MLSQKGGPVVKAPVAPPVVATKPVAPRPTVRDDPLVAAWRDCMGQALQNYEQSHTSTPCRWRREAVRYD